MDVGALEDTGSECDAVLYALEHFRSWWFFEFRKTA